MNPRAGALGAMGDNMKLVSRNGKYVLYLAPNFVIHLQEHQVKHVNVNGTKYAIVVIDNDPIHIEQLESQ